jgi:tetratricopeptide (TPR) repeat protein
VFRRLAAFAGGGDLQGAERVWGSGSAETLAALGRLCEHGLVQLEEAVGQSRWCLRDPIRDYAWARLVEDGEDLDTSRRHAALFSELAERAAPQLLGGDQVAARAQLSAERGNLRAALEWAARVGSGDGASADVAVRIAGSVWMWWRMEGAVEEGRLWLRRVLGLPAAGASPAYPLALWGAAWLEYQQGDLVSAADLGQRLLGVARTPVDRRNALTVLGTAALAEDRLDDALTRLEQAVELARAGGSAWHLATSLLNLGTARLRAGDPDGAEALVSEALTGHAQTGDDHFRARCLVAWGYCALLAGSTELAGARFGDALQAFLALDEQWGVAECVVAAAVHCAATGRERDAALLSGAGERALADLRINLLAPDVALASPYLATAREALGGDAWHEEQARGRELVLDDAVDRALTALERR